MIPIFALHQLPHVVPSLFSIVIEISTVIGVLVVLFSLASIAIAYWYVAIRGNEEQLPTEQDSEIEGSDIKDCTGDLCASLEEMDLPTLDGQERSFEEAFVKVEDDLELATVDPTSSQIEKTTTSNSRAEFTGENPATDWKDPIINESEEASF